MPPTGNLSGGNFGIRRMNGGFAIAEGVTPSQMPVITASGAGSGGRQMIDARKLLDQFIGTGSARPGATPQGQGGNLQGDLGQILGNVFGGAGGQGAARGGMGGLAGNAISGALAGGLASYILKNKGARKLGGSAIKLGGLALVAGLGYKAWTNYQARNAGNGIAAGEKHASQVPRAIPAQEIPDAAGTAFLPAPGEEEDHARLLLSAMIAAAKADGSIDAAEEEAIFGRIDSLNLDAEEKSLVMDELRRPLPPEDLAAQARTPEAAIEVYLASLLAIDPDQPSEQRYMEGLAAALGLAPELVAEIHRTRDDAALA